MLLLSLDLCSVARLRLPHLFHEGDDLHGVAALRHTTKHHWTIIIRTLACPNTLPLRSLRRIQVIIDLDGDTGADRIVALVATDIETTATDLSTYGILEIGSHIIVNRQGAAIRLFVGFLDHPVDLDLAALATDQVFEELLNL